MMNTNHRLILGLVCFVLVGIVCGHTLASTSVVLGGDIMAPTPAELAALVVPPVFGNSSSFLVWDYGGGIITDSLWEFVDLFNLPIQQKLNVFLDSEATDPSKTGYKILHDIKLPFGGAIGDSIGLFPIAYLARVNYYAKHPDSTYNNQTDIEIAKRVASEYVIPWPHTLPDGTVTRTAGWSGEPSGDEFLWDDDQYMGSTLVSRLSVLFNYRNYSDIEGKMQLTFGRRLILTDNLYSHGFNAMDEHHSCCPWGRANGWVMMSHIEVLLALQHTSKSPYFQDVLELFQRHAQGIIKLQSDNGLWHQVLNDTSTFLETSCSAMFLWSMVEGVLRNWLPKDQFGPVIEKAWNGLVTTIKSDGTVTGVCEGTGIGTDADWYNHRGTNYLDSRPGLGSVFKAISAYHRYSTTK